MSPRNRLRILHVIPSMAVRHGGVGRAVAMLSRTAIERGHRVWIVTAREQSEASHPVPGATFHRFRRGNPSRWYFSGELPGLLDRLIPQSDLVHVHGLWLYPGAAACRAALRAGVPYVVSPHGMLDGWALRQSRFRKFVYHWLIERSNLRHAAMLHAVSPSEQRLLARRWNPKPVSLVPNGFEPRELGFRVGHGSRKVTKGLVVYFGRLHPKKGVDILCEAFIKVSAELPFSRLVVIGFDESGMRPRLEARLLAAGLKGRFEFTGMLHGSARFRLLRKAAVSVLPSHSEGLPTSVIETMALGVPMITTTGCNLPEPLARCTTMVSRPTVPAIVGALRYVLHHQVAANAQARIGSRLVANSYSRREVGASMLAAYQVMLGAPAR